MIKLLFFGDIAAKISKSEICVTYKNDMTPKNIFLNLGKDYPQIEHLVRQQVLFAVNQVQVNPDQVLNDGDEVAFMPPFSGG